MELTHSQPRWRKSSQSATQGNCVEVAELPDVVMIRDSKDPDGPKLTVSRQGFRELIKSLCA